jgi:Carbamoyltransferase N-terminus
MKMDASLPIFATTTGHGEIYSRPCQGVNREDASASIQQVLESTMLCSIGRLLERAKARRLGAAASVFTNVHLNRPLAEQLPIDEIFLYSAMGDEGMSPAAHFATDGLPHWLRNGVDFSTSIYSDSTTITARPQIASQLCRFVLCARAVYTPHTYD